MAKRDNKILLFVLLVALLVCIVLTIVCCRNKKSGTEPYCHPSPNRRTTDEGFTVATIAFTDDLGDVLEEIKDKMVIHGKTSSQDGSNVKKVVSALQKGTTDLLGTVALYKKTPNTTTQATLTKQLGDFSAQSSKVEQSTDDIDSPALSQALEGALSAINDAIVALASVKVQPTPISGPPKSVKPKMPGKVTTSSVDILNTLSTVVQTAMSTYSQQQTEANYDQLSTSLNNLSSQANKYATDDTVMKAPGMMKAMQTAQSTIALASNIVMTHAPPAIPVMGAGATGTGKSIPYPIHPVSPIVRKNITDYDQQLTTMYTVLKELAHTYNSSPSLTNMQNLWSTYLDFVEKSNDPKYKLYSENSAALSNLNNLFGDIFAMMGRNQDALEALQQLNNFISVVSKALIVYNSDGDANSLVQAINPIIPPVQQIYSKYGNNSMFRDAFNKFNKLMTSAHDFFPANYKLPTK